MRNLSKIEFFALRLWACGLRRHELGIAMSWTRKEVTAPSFPAAGFTLTFA